MGAMTRLSGNLIVLVLVWLLHDLLLRRVGREGRNYRMLTGLLFGLGAVAGMAFPYRFAAGILFDGRSVLLGLAGLFGGAPAAGLAGLLAGAYRLWIGGAGTPTGLLIILVSAGLGAAYGRMARGRPRYLGLGWLWGFGLIVHLAVLGVVLTLPGGVGLEAVEEIVLAALLAYPVATMLAGALLLGEVRQADSLRALRENEARLRALYESSLDAILLTAPDGRIFAANAAACRLFGRREEEICRLGRAGVVDLSDPRLGPALEERVRSGRYQGELMLCRADGSRFPGEVSSVVFRDRSGELRTSMIIRDISQRRKDERRVARLNRALRMVGRCGQSLVRATTEEALLREVCRIVVEEGGHRMAWVGYAERDPAKSIRVKAWAGVEGADLDALRLTWGEERERHSPSGEAIRTGVPCVVRRLDSDPRFVVWHQESIRRGFVTSVALPLRDAEGIFGALGIYSRDEGAFDDDEVGLLAELADDLAYGIRSIRTRLAHERALGEIEVLSRFPDENPNPVLRVSGEGRLLYANSHGVPLLAAWGVGVGEWLPTGERRQAVRALETGKSVETELVCGERLYAVRWVPLSDRGYVNIYGQDVTERRRAEEALQASEARYRELFEVGPEALFLVDDLTGRLLEANTVAVEMYGYSREELLALRDADLSADPEETARLAGGAPPESGAGPLRYHRRKGGGLFPVEAASRHFVWKGRPVRVASIRDITERRRLEAQRAEMDARFREQQRLESLGVLAGGWPTRSTTRSTGS